MRSFRNRTYILLSIFFMSWASSGCVPGKTYSYDAVRGEYVRRNAVAQGGAVSADASPAKAVEGPVSLEDAIGIALAGNPDKKMALARIRKSAAGVGAAQAAFYPSLGLYTGYLEGDSPSAYLFRKIDQRELAPDTDFNDPGKIRNFESGVTARLNLYNGGQDRLGVQIARTGEQISRLDLHVVENSLIASVIETYYDTLAAKSLISIAEESVITVDTQLRVMNVRYRAGGALKSDILSLEVRLAEAREEAVIAQNRYLKTIAALANLMGIGPEPPLSLVENDREPLRLPEHYLGGVAMALELRPELRKIRRQVEQSRMNIDRARSGYLPRVNLEGRYYLDDEDLAYDIDRDNWTVGVMLEWDIFTGFSTKSRELEAEAALEEILSADRGAALAVKLDVKNAYLNAESAKARYETAEASVEAAEESLRLVKKQYEGGSVDITRYLRAELDRNHARTRAAAAFYDREKALAGIARAVGYWTTNRPDSNAVPVIEGDGRSEK